MTVRAFTPAFLALAVAAGLSGTAEASERDKKFFHSVAGSWSGPGEIVAGKYKGTKFVCNFIGATPVQKVGVSLDGGCRVGLFTQKMSATVEHAGRAGYRGTFMDGSEGAGLDVVGGSVKAREVVFTLNRNALNGAMLARLPDDNTLNVTVSVRVDDEMVPVIGMSLKRVDERPVGAVTSN